MRHCKNETVDVYETSGTDLGLLLIEVSGLLGKHAGWANVHTDYQLDTGEYLVTTYLH
jgi:hypothetical protein